MMMLAVLNPNLTTEDLIKLRKQSDEAKVKVVEEVIQAMKKMETREQKIRYMNLCMPALMTYLFTI